MTLISLAALISIGLLAADIALKIRKLISSDGRRTAGTMTIPSRSTSDSAAASGSSRRRDMTAIEQDRAHATH